MITSSPSTYTPSTAAELIGPARAVGLSLERKVARIQDTGLPLKLFFTGAPGCGKTSLALILARQLAHHELGMQSINGADVGADAVRRYRDEFFPASMFSDWRVLVINEADKISPQAQVLMLTLLDDLPRFRAVICTSNLETADLIERFQTRFQLWKIGSPAADEITALINRLVGPGLDGRTIAKACAGNVRSALLDTESALDFQPA